NQVQGNKIGTNAADTAVLGNSIGVDIEGYQNTVGYPPGGPVSAGNVISGNTMQGVLIESSGLQNTLRGNMIGLNAASAVRLPNLIGVDIFGLENDVLSNVIGESTSAGVRIEFGASGNELLNNQIAANDTGVDIFGSENMVGSAGPGEGNVISGNDNI